MSRLVRFYVGGSPGDALVSADQHAVRAARVARVLAFYGVQGATILPAIGVWNGDLEPSLVVEIVEPSDSGDRASTENLAQDLRAEFAQSAVLVVETLVTSFLEGMAP